SPTQTASPPGNSGGREGRPRARTAFGPRRGPPMPLAPNGEIASRRLGQTTCLPRHPPAQSLVEEWIHESLGLAEDWKTLSPEDRERLLCCPDAEVALSLLVEKGLLTEYQAGRISAGTLFGLVLGNYRVLDRIGAGGMAVVFKGEHLDLRHVVA